MNFKTIDNPIYTALFLQLVAEKEHIEFTPTYLNSSVVHDKSFSPNFLVLKACKEESSEAICYVIFRTTRRSVFSSVIIVDKTNFDVDKPIYKKHISDIGKSNADLLDFCNTIISVINSIPKV